MHTTDKSAEAPGPIPTSTGTNAEESRLISGKAAQGTKVYSPEGEELGQIDDVIIEPVSGRVVYGVLQFGGFMGLGADYHPIPFGRLKYDGARGGYVTDLTKEQLEGAPRHDENWYHNRDWQERSHKHYGVDPYW
jgi:hypothetical protein